MARRFLGDVRRFAVDNRLVVDGFFPLVLILDADPHLGAARAFRSVGFFRSIRGAVRFLRFAICYPK
jgi:hypothetical protein